MKFSKVLLEIVKIGAGVFLAALLIRTFLFQPFVVDGSSMEPNFHNGEYLFVEKLSYDFHRPQRGDVVVFKYPLDTSVDYIKRIIGLPGDTITIRNGQVLVNGQALTENYLPSGQKTVILSGSDADYTVTVPNGEYFMMGDNRDHSADSREGWLLPRRDIIGRTALVLFPASNFHAIAAPKY